MSKRCVASSSCDNEIRAGENKGGGLEEDWRCVADESSADFELLSVDGVALYILPSGGRPMADGRFGS